MKKLSFKCFVWVLLSCTPLFFTACSEDDDSDVSEEREYDGSRDIDELDVLQQNLVRTDASGNFQQRVFGEKLDMADSTIVSVGVESFEEAQGLFHNLFSDTTKISADGNYATFTIQSGTAELKKKDEANGLVGVVEFDVPGLKYISQINFILNSAWPENASSKGFHKAGTWYQYHGWTAGDNKNEWHHFLCIREKNNGSPALLVAFSKETWTLTYNIHNTRLQNLPSKSKAIEIRGILRKDATSWEKYKKLYNDKIGHTVLADYGEYWIGEGANYGLWMYRYAMNLNTGSVSWYDVGYKDPKKTAMFYIESMDVMQ